MLSVLLILIKQLAIPEIMDLVRRRAAANNGVIPTTEEVQAEFSKVITEGISKGENWLAQHPG
jgi:hypothetical protein